MVAGGVPTPRAARAGDLPGGGGGVEAEGVGDDWGGGLQDELAQRGDAGLLDRESERAQPGVQGGVGDGLSGEPSGEQQGRRRAGRVTRCRSSAANGSGTGAGGSPRRMSSSPSWSRTSAVVRCWIRLSGWA